MNKKEINKYTKEQRIRRIAECKKCMGSPPTKTCNLQGLIFQVCDLDGCMEIVGEYRKEGMPIRVEKKVPIPATFQEPDFRKEINVSEIPGLNNLDVI